MGAQSPEVSQSFSSKVLACVAGIPQGRVMSYRGIAACAGSRSARAVGQVLAQCGGSVPWHRVVHADGTLADHLRLEQSRLLAAEGVPLKGERVIMEWAEWGHGAGQGRHEHALREFQNNAHPGRGSPGAPPWRA